MSKKEKDGYVKKETMMVVFLHDLNDRENAVKAWGNLLQVNPMAKVQSGELVMDLVGNIKAKKAP